MQSLTVFWTFLAIISSLYFLTTTVLLLSAKFKKNAKGNLILDPDSWHFKLSHPILIRKFSSDTIKTHPEAFKGTIPSSICPYAINFFLMLYVGWPVLILWSCLKTVLYFPFMTLFGYYPIANITSMIQEDNPTAVKVGKIPIPKIGGHKIFPAYLALPIAYFAGWHYYPNITFRVSIIALLVAIGIAIIASLFWLTETDQKEVSLARQWLSAKKNKVCWKLEMASEGKPTDVEPASDK